MFSSTVNKTTHTHTHIEQSQKRSTVYVANEFVIVNHFEIFVTYSSEVNTKNTVRSENKTEAFPGKMHA